MADLHPPTNDGVACSRTPRRHAGRSIRAALLFTAGALWWLFGNSYAFDHDEVTELTRAREIYHDQLERITEAADRKSSAVDAAYFAALDQLEQGFQARGELHGVLAIRGEKNRLRPRPDEPVMLVTPLPDDIQKLATRHQQQTNAITAEHAIEKQAISKKYIDHLDELKRDLTRQNRLHDALAVDNEMRAVRNSEAHQTVGDLSDVTDTQVATVDMHQRLGELRIGRFQYTSRRPVNAINQLIESLHPAGIEVRIESGKVPVSSVAYDREGRPRYTQSADSTASRYADSRNIDLRRGSARDALQSICDTFALGYYFDGNTIVVVDAEDPRAIWFRLSVTPETLVNQFTENTVQALTRYRGIPIRITGPLAGMTRNVAGQAVAILHGRQPLRIELATDEDGAEWARLYREFQRQREASAAAAGSTNFRRLGDSPPPSVRRLGDDDEIIPPPSRGPYLVLSIVAEYDSHFGSNLKFNNGRNLWWQRTSQEP